MVSCSSKKKIIFMYPAVLLLLNTCCVAHLYFGNFIRYKSIPLNSYHQLLLYEKILNYYGVLFCSLYFIPRLKPGATNILLLRNKEIICELKCHSQLTTSIIRSPSTFLLSARPLFINNWFALQFRWIYFYIFYPLSSPRVNNMHHPIL